MSCEPFGTIPVEQYLRETLPDNTRAFVETNEGLRELFGVSCRGNNYFAEIKNPPGRCPLNTYYCRVRLQTPVYLAYEDLSSLEAVTVKTEARHAVFEPRLSVREAVLPCEGVPLGTYWHS